MCAVDQSSNSTALSASNSTSGSNGTTGGSSENLVCVSTLGADPKQLSVDLFGTAGGVVPTLDLALNLQKKILAPIIIIAAVLMLVGAGLFALVKVTQMKLSNPELRENTIKQTAIFKPLALASIWMAVCFAFAAALSSTMATNALNFIIPVLATNIQVTGGSIVQAMQYLAFIFGGLFGLAATLFLPEALEQQAGLEGEQKLNEKGLDEDGNPIDDEEVEYDEDGNPIPREQELDEDGNPIEREPELDEDGNPIEREPELDEDGNPIENDERGAPYPDDDDYPGGEDNFQDEDLDDQDPRQGGGRR
jgi:hypothetical protein